MVALPISNGESTVVAMATSDHPGAHSRADMLGHGFHCLVRLHSVGGDDNVHVGKVLIRAMSSRA